MPVTRLIAAFSLELELSNGRAAARLTSVAPAPRLASATPATRLASATPAARLASDFAVESDGRKREPGRGEVRPLLTSGVVERGGAFIAARGTWRWSASLDRPNTGELERDGRLRRVGAVSTTTDVGLGSAEVSMGCRGLGCLADRLCGRRLLSPRSKDLSLPPTSRRLKKEEHQRHKS